LDPSDQSGAASRAAAARILARVLAGRSLNELLRFEAGTTLTLRDQSFVRYLCFGVCRWYPRLEKMAEVLLRRAFRKRDADVLALLYLGLFQLREKDIAAHAAISSTVSAAKKLGKHWASGVLNASLRRFQRETEAIEKQVMKTTSARWCLPDWLLQRLQHAWPEHLEQIALAMLQAPPMTLRVNPMCYSRTDWLRLAAEQGLLAEPSPLSDSGIILQQAMEVTQLPGFTRGAVSVQDSGAQLAALLLEPAGGEVILDACSAPGGKTGHLLELCEDKLELLAVDISARRLSRVEENMQRIGVHARLLAADLADVQRCQQLGMFDRILLDAPCSATGVIRRHPDIRILRHEDDIAPLVSLQRQLLENCWQQLKPGGRLLYVTCSLLPEENDVQIESFVARHQEAAVVAINTTYGHPQAFGCQWLPGDGDWDGFYYASLEKCQ